MNGKTVKFGVSVVAMVALLLATGSSVLAYEDNTVIDAEFFNNLRIDMIEEEL